jgi:hypothetical protein
VNDSFF